MARRLKRHHTAGTVSEPTRGSDGAAPAAETGAERREPARAAGRAARKLRTRVANLGRILAVELVCAARGLDVRAPLKPAPATARCAARCGSASRAPGPTGSCRRSWRPPRSRSARAAILEAVRRPDGALA